MPTCSQSEFPVRGRFPYLRSVLNLQHQVGVGASPDLRQQKSAEVKGGENASASDQSHISRAGSDGRESRVLTSDWLEEVTLFSNGKARPVGVA